MSYPGEPIKERDARRCEANQVQAVMQQIHEHLRVKMRRSQAIQEEGTNRRRVPAPNIEVGSEMWLDARNVSTLALLVSYIGNCWDLTGYRSKCPPMLMSWSYLGQ
jgi:hypothetical protein